MVVTKLILTIIQLLTCLFMIVVVLLQSGKRSGLSGAIAGGADTFLSKSKSVTLDAKLAKMTKWVGLAFVLLTLVLNLI
ncbi:MAG: preprotein translocase subunit SecG [Oscillospiraceae bacterium]|jgi:preprotein translocase subunit SecG|nr:preprotein translocase subunit SecG [Oscillospiraceae bacterium]